MNIKGKLVAKRNLMVLKKWKAHHYHSMVMATIKKKKFTILQGEMKIFDIELIVDTIISKVVLKEEKCFK